MNAEDTVKLIKGCRSKNRRSQKKLYQEFYAYGMSICIRYADNREEAAEILNDAFMKILTNIRQFELDKPFKPWLRKIFVNTAITHYHRRQKSKEMSGLESVLSEASSSGNILEDINYQEIISLIQQLSPQYRAVFNLYVIEGFKHEEIAQQLGISVGTSKSNLAKAKRNLKAKLNHFFLNAEDERRKVNI